MEISVNGHVRMVIVRFETLTEAETLTTYKFPHSGNLYMVMVCFETLTKAETFQFGGVGRGVWVPFSLNFIVWR